MNEISTATKTSSSGSLTRAGRPCHSVPAHLLQPLWLRSRESLVEDGLVYDPIAANACRSCHVSSDCLSGDVDQKQLLHTTLTKLCDQRVKSFLRENPNGWVLNLGAGLDTRFYRLDNGRCQWIELDVAENLIWRERLFHRNERYQLRNGSVDSFDWITSLSIPPSAPVLIVCEQALLNRSEPEVAKFIQTLGRYFMCGQLCCVLAGDLASGSVGKRMGGDDYRHGFRRPADKVTQWLPWNKYTNLYSPLDDNCNRWKTWQKAVSSLPALRNRFTPVLIETAW